MKITEVKIINSWENYFYLGKIKKLGVNFRLGVKIIIFGRIIIYESSKMDILK